MPDRDQIQLVLLNIKLVDNTVISDSQPKCINTLHPIVRKPGQITPNLVNLLLNSLLDIEREIEEPPIKAVAANLSGRP